MAAHLEIVDFSLEMFFLKQYEFTLRMICGLIVSIKAGFEICVYRSTRAVASMFPWCLNKSSIIA
jgi:hypothetical protein